MLALSLVTLAVAAQSVQAASSILFPLYFYPTEVSEKGCWAELRNAAKLHTNNLPITVILNPNSGPIKDPNDDYLRCIPLLRRDLGAAATITAYVRTDYTKRSATLVNRDVAMYKTWDNIKVDAPGLGKVTLGAPKGIFFDEASNEDSATPIARYKAYAATTRSTFGASAKVILNPGTKAAAGYYAYSDFIVSYESAYSQYSATNSVVATSSTPYAKQIIMVHSLPTKTSGGKSPTTILTTLLDQLVKEKRVGAVFVNDINLDVEDIYARFAPDFAQVNAGVAYRNARL